jgi:hypothetical protein
MYIYAYVCIYTRKYAQLNLYLGTYVCVLCAFLYVCIHIVTCYATVDAVQIVSPFIYNLTLTFIRSAVSHLHSLQSLILL